MFLSKVYYSPWQRNNTEERVIRGKERRGNRFGAMASGKTEFVKVPLLPFFFFFRCATGNSDYILLHVRTLSAHYLAAYFKIVIVSVKCRDNSRFCIIIISTWESEGVRLCRFLYVALNKKGIFFFFKI